MVDEDLFGKEIIAALHQLGSAVDVKTIVECDFPTGTKDKALVAATQRKRRILLTANYNDINERKYPPCEHGGIILIYHPNPSAEVVSSRLKAFCQSGKRSQAKGHVTYLSEDKFKIYKLHEEIIEEKYDEKTGRRKITKRSKRVH
jgi:hypothetical protein